MRRASLVSILLFVGLALSVPVLAGSFGLGVTPGEIHPGDAVAFDVTGAPANARLVLFASLDPTPTTLGPIETRCGTFQLDLGLDPRLRLHGLRTDDDGNASIGFDVPRRLPARFDGLTVYAQAATIQFAPDRSGGCTLTSCTSNVASATIAVP